MNALLNRTSSGKVEQSVLPVPENPQVAGGRAWCEPRPRTWRCPPDPKGKGERTQGKSAPLRSAQRSFCRKRRNFSKVTGSSLDGERLTATRGAGAQGERRVRRVHSHDAAQHLARPYDERRRNDFRRAQRHKGTVEIMTAPPHSLLRKLPPAMLCCDLGWDLRSSSLCSSALLSCPSSSTSCLPGPGEFDSQKYSGHRTS